MPKFIKRPTEIEAEQYTETNQKPKGICLLLACYNSAPHVHTIHGGQVVLLTFGDWIVSEPDDIHYYPVKPDIFENTYEIVKE